MMHGGLELARPRRHKIRLWVWLILLAALLLIWFFPRLAAACPAELHHWDETLGNFLLPRYTERLAELTEQNAVLHSQLAAARDALTENEAFRSLTGCGRAEGSWQPGQVVVRRAHSVTLSCTGQEGAAVLDPQGRYAGRVTRSGTNDTCEVTLVGAEDFSCAGLAGGYAGLLEYSGDWTLTALPADCGLSAGTPVTTPGGYWLGTLAAAPHPDEDGLTACAPLADTADLSSTVFFVKIG